MPRKRSLSPPACCLHKICGRAVVRIDGRDFYLGPHSSPESHAEYARLIAEWRAKASERVEQQKTAPQLVGFDLTVSQVLLRNREFAEGYNIKDGQPAKELVEMRYALRPLRQFYGHTFVREFGPLNLKAVR